MEHFFLISLLLCIFGSLAEVRDRIISGKVADHGQFPYQISLRYGSSHICGGSILDEFHILTAAHCLTDSNDKPYNSLRHLSVLVGSNDVSPTFPKIYRFKKFTLHENYNATNNFINDIAIITLNRKIMTTTFVQPINLPEKDVPEGSTVVLSGWGDLVDPLGPTDGTPRYLRMMETRIVSNNICGSVHRTNIPQQQLCAFKKKGHGACSGDSGGPLVFNETVVGIASWVDNLCANGAPDVFTRVYEYVPWIKKVVENDEK